MQASSGDNCITEPLPHLSGEHDGQALVSVRLVGTMSFPIILLPSY